MRKQQGIGMLPALVLLGVASVIGTAAVRLMPIYLDNWTLDNIIEDVVAEYSGKDNTPAQVRSVLSRHFVTNRVESISLRDIEITSEREGVVIDASYETRTKLFFNIDAIVKFEGNTFVIPRS